MPQKDVWMSAKRLDPVVTDAAGRHIPEFRDRFNNPCYLHEYMKSYGLFGSRTTFFLQTKEKDSIDTEANEDRGVQTKKRDIL